MPDTTAQNAPRNVSQRPLRLLAVGDCNTGGALGTAAKDRVSSRLAARFEAHGISCAEQNLGYTMSTTREGLARMQRDAEPADLLVLNFGLVDAWVTSIPRVYIPYYPDGVFKRLGRKLLKSVKRRLRAPLLRRFVPIGAVVPIEEYEQNMRRIMALAREQNPAVRILLWGTVPVVGDAERSRKIALYNVRLRNIAEAEPETWYLETMDVLKGLNLEEIYLDHLHIAAAAAERIAEEMLQISLTRMPLGANIPDLPNAA